MPEETQINSDSVKKIYLVEIVEFDSTRVCAASMDPDAAEAYRAELEAQSREADPDNLDRTSFSVVEMPLDAPREHRLGAWDIEVSPETGRVKSATYALWATPARHPQTQIDHVRGRGPMTHSYRAWGRSVEEATANARAYRTAEISKQGQE